MNEHRIEEQAQEIEQAFRWKSASVACGVAAGSLFWFADALTMFLSSRYSIDSQAMTLTCTVLTIVWLAAMASCAARATRIAGIRER